MRSRWADYRNLIEIHLPREDVVDLDLDLQVNRAAINSWGLFFSFANDVLFNDLHGAEFVSCEYQSKSINCPFCDYLLLKCL